MRLDSGGIMAPMNPSEWVDATEANMPLEVPGRRPETVLLHGEWVHRLDISDFLARRAKQEPPKPCKWRGIFRGGGE